MDLASREDLLGAVKLVQPTIPILGRRRLAASEVAATRPALRGRAACQRAGAPRSANRR